MHHVLSVRLKGVFVLILATLLSSCGFHLRGDYSVPDSLHTISITSYDAYSTLTRHVKAQLRMSKIDIVSPSETIPNLNLLNESISERTLSLYQNARAAEKELTFRTSYRITIPNVSTRTFTTSVTRSYLNNPLTALAKSVEREMIENEMRKLAAVRILRQMARLKAGEYLNEGEFDKAIEENIIMESATVENSHTLLSFEGKESQPLPKN